MQFTRFICTPPSCNAILQTLYLRFMFGISRVTPYLDQVCINLETTQYYVDKVPILATYLNIKEISFKAEFTMNILNISFSNVFVIARDVRKHCERSTILTVSLYEVLCSCFD